MANSTTTSKKRKNIQKDATTYWLSHEARILIQEVAHKRHLKPPSLLEIVAQDLAATYLTDAEREKARTEAQKIEEDRRTNT